MKNREFGSVGPFRMRALAGTVALLGGLALLAFSTDADAKRKKKRAFEISAHTGYSIPLGEQSNTEGEKMSDVTKGQIPLIIDIGYRASPVVFVGAYFGPSWGRLSKAEIGNCQVQDRNCYQLGLRAGLSAMFHLQPRIDTDPWLGVSAGYEGLRVMKRGTAHLNQTYSGWELGARGGVDFKLSKRFAIGPMLSLATGQYGSRKTSCSGDCVDERTPNGGIANRGLHTWVTLGFRGAFVGW